MDNLVGGLSGWTGKNQATAKRQKASKHYPGVIARVPSISERSNGTVDAFDVRFEKSTLDGNSVPRGWIRKVRPQHPWRGEFSVRVGSPARGRTLRLRAFDLVYATQWVRALSMISAGHVEHVRKLRQLELAEWQRRHDRGRSRAASISRNPRPGAQRAASVVMMRQRSVYVEEGTSLASVDVMRVGSCDKTMYVYYDTPDLHARDVHGVCGALCFPPGAQRRVIKFPVRNNAAYENGRFYKLKLLGCSAGGEIGSSAHAFTFINVVDNDHYPGPLALQDLHDGLAHGPGDKGLDLTVPGNVQLCERKSCKFKHCNQSLEHVLSTPGESVLARPTPGDRRFPAKVLAPARDGRVHLRWDNGLTSVEDRFYLYHHLNKKMLILDFLRERYRSLWPMPLKSLLFACYSAVDGIIQTIIPLLVIDMVILPHLKTADGGGVGDGAVAISGVASSTTAPAATCDSLWGAERNAPDCPFAWNLAFILAALYMFSAVLSTFICTYYAEANDGCPETKRDLRNSLVSRFMALSEQAHFKVGTSEYLEACQQQVDLIISQVWSTHYAVVVLLLELALQVVAGTAISAGALAVLLASNAIVIGFIFLLSVAHFQRCEEREAHTETMWTETLRDLAENAKLYHSYAQFSAARIKEAEFAREIEANMQASIASWEFMRHRTNALATVNKALVAGLLVVGARLCASGDAEIGELVAMLSIYARCSAIINGLFECAVKLVRGASALQRVCQILNMPVAHTTKVSEAHEHPEDKFAWAAVGLAHAVRAKTALKRRISESKGQSPRPGQAPSDPPQPRAARKSLVARSVRDLLRRDLSLGDKTTSVLIGEFLAAGRASQSGSRARDEEVGVATDAHTDSPLTKVPAGASEAEVQQFVAGQYIGHAVGLEGPWAVRQMLELRLENVTFAWKTGSVDHGPVGASSVATNLSCDLPAGHTIWLRPPAATSRRGALRRSMLTLMKIISGQVVPDTGRVLKPEHHVPLLVQHEPLVCEGTVLHNLLLGIPPARTVPELLSQHRFAWRVVKALGLPNRLDGSQKVRESALRRLASGKPVELAMDYDDEQGYMICPGGDNARLVDRMVICLARALISAPQVLLLDRPTALLNDAQARRVYGVLRQYVDRNGVFGEDAGAGAGEQAGTREGEGKEGGGGIHRGGTESGRSVHADVQRERWRVLNVRTVLFSTGSESQAPPGSGCTLVAQFIGGGEGEAKVTTCKLSTYDSNYRRAERARRNSTPEQRYRSLES